MNLTLLTSIVFKTDGIGPDLDAIKHLKNRFNEQLDYIII